MSYRAMSCAALALLCCGGAQANPIREVAGPVQQVQVVSDTAPAATVFPCSSTTYANIPGAALSITIPAGASQLLVARFTGQVTAMQTNPGVASVEMRIVVGTRELNPAGTNVVASNATPFQAPTAFERSGPISPGTHTVHAQFCVDGDDTSRATVSDWHFSIEAASAADH